MPVETLLMSKQYAKLRQFENLPWHDPMHAV